MFHLRHHLFQPNLGISLSFSFVTVSELFCCEFFEAFVNSFSDCIIDQIYYFLIFHYYTIILISDHQ